MRFANRRAGWSAAFGALLLALGCSPPAPDQPDPDGVDSAPDAPTFDGAPPAPSAPFEPRPDCVKVNDARAFRGYTLLAPLQSKRTCLLDLDGRVVNSWTTDCIPALGAALLEDGHLLRAGALPDSVRPFVCAGGGGRVQEFDWTGNLVWDFRYYNDRHLPHHDALKLPNGNVLLIVSERVPAAEALAAGRRPASFDGDYLLSDGVVEVKPTGPNAGEIVWAWRVWDHLVQEREKTGPNFGTVAEHPERIDLNFPAGTGQPPVASGPDLAKLQALGYVGAAAGGSKGGSNEGDWTHLNSVAYNPELDQIALTGLGFSEVWVIDHSATRAEAAGHTGGKRGRGGDLLYRWGNPRAYRHGTTADQRLRSPHNAHWIAPGLPGAGHLLVFNNNGALPIPVRCSAVVEIVPPLDSTGAYTRPTRAAFGPEHEVWSYTGGDAYEFHSPTFSGAQRLPNGNTLVCLGLPGTVLEVTREGEVVWKYVLPGEMNRPRPPGVPQPGRGPQMRPGQGPPRLPALIENSLFRAPRYAPDYPGLVGKDLTPKPAP